MSGTKAEESSGLDKSFPRCGNDNKNPGQARQIDLMAEDYEMERQKALIERTEEALGAPVTHGRIVMDLRRLGVREGDVLLTHTSLSSAGWICGGAETLIRALIEALGEDGTLVMPAYSGNYSEPDGWEAPSVPEGWRGVIRESMPGWDPALTPTWGIGRVPELFRHFPGARRSVHPLHSFAALGARADVITARHVLEDGLGAGSPLGRVYELRGRVLLIGCGHGSNTSLHLAEHRAEWPGKKRILQGAPIMDESGRRVWRRFEQLGPVYTIFAAPVRPQTAPIKARGAKFGYSK